MDNIIELIYFIVAIGVGYFFGTAIEKKHYASIQKREKELLHLPSVTTEEWIDQEKNVLRSEFISGNVVIAVDRFKAIVGGLRSILGGRVSAYESVMDRARREAVLRMKESAREADMILNLRIETSDIEEGNIIEAFACATAIYYTKP